MTRNERTETNQAGLAGAGHLMQTSFSEVKSSFQVQIARLTINFVISFTICRVEAD